MHVWQGPYKTSWSVVWQEIQGDLNRAAFWLLSWLTVCALIRLVFIRLTLSVTMGTDQSWTRRTLCLARFFLISCLFMKFASAAISHLWVLSRWSGCRNLYVQTGFAKATTSQRWSVNALSGRGPLSLSSHSLTVWTSVSPRSVNDGCVVLVRMMRLLCVNPPPPPHPALCLRLTTWWPGWASPCEWPSCEAQCLWGLLAPCLSPD